MDKFKTLLAAYAIAKNYDYVPFEDYDEEDIVENLEDCSDVNIVRTALQKYTSHSSGDIESIIVIELRNKIEIEKRLPKVIEQQGVKYTLGWLSDTKIGYITDKTSFISADSKAQLLQKLIDNGIISNN